MVTPLMAAPRPVLMPAQAAPEVRTVSEGLDLPWGLAFLPDGSALVTERDSARLLHVTAEGEVGEVGTIDGVEAGGEGGLLGVAVSADFETDHLVFLYYTTASDNRIVRATYEDGRLGEQEVIVEGIPHSPTRHNGGRLAFGPDGMLYATTGDAEEGESAQDTSSLAGKILRMTPDGQPADGNPFEGSLVWSYGHRNAQGLAWDPSGRLYASELGEGTFDEVNLIEPGRNYGWPTHEGPADGEDGGGDFVDPLLTWNPADASPSDAAYLDGSLYVAALRGSRLWRVPVNDDGTLGQPQALLEGDHGRLRAVEPAPDGTLWVTTSNGSASDQILALTFPDAGTGGEAATPLADAAAGDGTADGEQARDGEQGSTTADGGGDGGVSATEECPPPGGTGRYLCPVDDGSAPPDDESSTDDASENDELWTVETEVSMSSSTTTTPCSTTSSSAAAPPEDGETSTPTSDPETTTDGSNSTVTDGSTSTTVPPCSTTTSTTAPSSTTSSTTSSTAPSTTSTAPPCPTDPPGTESSTTSTSSSTTVTTTATPPAGDPSAPPSDGAIQPFAGDGGDHGEDDGEASSTTSTSSTTTSTPPSSPPSTVPTTTSSSSTSSSTSTSTPVPPCPTTTAPAMAQPSTTPTTAPTTTVPPGESLPRTGSNTGRLVAIGVGLLLAGGFLVMSAHRYGTGLVPAVAPAVQPVAPRPPIRSAGQPGSATGTTIFETWKRSRFGR